MASIISAGTTSGTSLNLSGDTSGVLQLATNGSTTAITVDTSQNVGIGTASPVFGSGSGVELYRAGIATYRLSSSGAGVEFRNNSGTGELEVRGAFPLVFGTNATERMRITSTGNVGLGTTNPGARFEVAGTTTSTTMQITTTTGAPFTTYRNTGQDFYVGLDNSTGASFGSQYSANLYGTGAYPMLFWTSGVERFRIASSGETTFTKDTSFTNTNFSGRLGGATGYGYWSNSDVSSYVQLNGSSNATPYRVYVVAQSGGVYMAANGTSWTANSDARLKNITGTFTNALADVLQIEAVKFTWKSDEKNKPCVGLIAQSVEKVLPEAVSKGVLNNSEDKTEYLGVQYTEVIPLLVAAIQELKAELDATKAEVAALKGVN